MVDVGAKPDTERVAEAKGSVTMSPETFSLVREGGFDKGDVLGIARIAGVMAAKQTSNLIPLCHPLRLTQVNVDITPYRDGSGLEITSTASNPRQNRCRNGSPHGRLHRGPHHLRHVQVCRPRHDHRRHKAHPQVRRQKRRLPGLLTSPGRTQDRTRFRQLRVCHAYQLCCISPIVRLTGLRAVATIRGNHLARCQAKWRCSSVVRAGAS